MMKSALPRPQSDSLPFGWRNTHNDDEPDDDLIGSGDIDPDVLDQIAPWFNED